MHARTPLPLSLGILSWHGYGSLRASLESHRDAGLLDMVEEALVFFPEITEQGRSLAREFGLKCAGSDKNLGILGGFEALARSLSGRTLLLLENDLALVENGDEVRRQLLQSIALLESGRARVVRLRSRREPGEPFGGLRKYRRYHPPPGEPWLGAALRRLVRPDKAMRLRGTACYALDEPERAFPDDIERVEGGFHLVRTRSMNWTNLAIMVQRDFFLDTVIARAKSHPSRRGINGFPNIEIELNSRWWRRQDWRVAVAPGLFTHARLDDRGY